MPIPPYIVDFECRLSKLIIEIDSGQHSFAEEALRDATRDQNLPSAGYCVLRFWNNPAYREFEGAMEAIRDAFDQHPPGSPEGEG